MSLRFYQVAVDARDPAALARFWAEALGYRVLLENEEEVVIGVDETAYPGLVFVPVPEAKSGKNRLHLDLAPDDQDAEVARLLDLGATVVDVGQSADVPWQVLADPEGNEFCVLSPKSSLTDSWTASAGYVTPPRVT
ncbi:VOC family protein [Kitasatospora brasiliensis]|uniref:VOC family protein n=1 Tax=Kitasatospora brasiliensis TaxID=3058040 RepID=UPI00293176FC|nr:VOC family protein [Kitasatospora sp. K002]